MSVPAASPLVEIERAVQERAKDISLEMSAPAGERELQALIADEVTRWNDDHRRGRRAFELPDPALVAERAFRNLARYGPLSPLLDDDDVWEIMVNAPDAIFVRRHRGTSGYHDEVFHDDDHVVRTLTKLLDDASTAHRKLDPAEGLQDAQLDDGARLHIVHGDIARGGHVLVNIRKFTGIPFKTLDELVDRGMLTGQVAHFLRACVHARLSIVFAGPPGSGKTTLLSCAAAELDPALRVVVAEEVFESDVPVPNVAQMQTRGGAGRPPGRRPPPARRRVPAHGARRGDRRRGARHRGAAVAPDPVLGRDRLHHDPRRVGPPGADPPAVRLPARGNVRRAAADARSTHWSARASTSSSTALGRRAAPA